MSIDIDRAGAALRRVATDMGAGEAKIVPQQVNQQLARFHGSGPARTVDADRHDVTLLIGISHAFLQG